MNKIQIQVSVSQRDRSDADRKSFNINANIVAFMYQRHIGQRVKGLRKITLELFAEENVFFISDFQQTLSVCVIDISFNFKEYFEKNKREQTETILETLHASVLKMCEKFDLDKAPFATAYEKVIESNYTNRYITNRLTLSRNRKHKAGVEINMTEQGAEISVVFTDKEGNILQRREVFRTQPHYFFVYQVIYSGKWLDNNRYVASSKNKSVNFIADINSEELVIDLQPKEREKEIREKLEMVRFKP